MRLSFVVVLTGLAVLWVARLSPIPVPVTILSQAEARLNKAVADIGLTVELGAAQVDLRENLSPAVAVNEVAVFDRAGDLLVAFDRIEALFSRDDALAARVVPKAVLASGVAISLSRDAQGRLTLQLGDATVVQDAASPAQALERLQVLLASPWLAGLTTLGVDELGITLDDGRDGRRISSRNGALRILRDKFGALTLDADMGEFDDGATLNSGRIAVHLSSPTHSAPGELRLTLRGLSPARVRGVVGAGPLSELLSRLDAPVSLDLNGAIDADGTPHPLIGSLNVGAGQIVSPGAADSIDLDGLRADLALSADRSYLSITDMSLRSGLVTMSGRADLRRATAATLTGQVALTDVRTKLKKRDGGDLELAADRLWSDMRFNRSTGLLEIGAVTLELGGVRLVGSGVVDRKGQGGAPRLALDLAAAELDRESLLAIWPAAIATGTRAWLERELIEGDVQGVHLAMRHDFGAPRKDGRGGLQHLALDFGFDGTQISLVKGLPQLEQARGFGSLARHQFGLRASSGKMPVSATGHVSLVGATAGIEWLGRKGARSDGVHAPLLVSLSAEGTLPNAIALLGQPLFQPKDRAIDAEAAPSPLMAEGAVDGRVRTDVDLSIPLGPDRKGKKPDFQVGGEVYDARSETLVAGHVLASDRLEFTATGKEVTVDGPAEFDGLPIHIGYSRRLEQPSSPTIGDPWRPVQRPAPTRAPGYGTLVADLPVTAELFEKFGARLPKGALRGETLARMTLDLAQSGPHKVQVNADLKGLGVSVPALGVYKSKAADGQFDLVGQIGPQPAIDSVNLRMPGLRLDASARMRDRSGGSTGGTGLAELTVNRLALGKWLDARGRYAPGGRLSLTGGTLDLRFLPPQNGHGSGRTGPGMDVALDTVRLAEKLALTDVRGTLSSRMHGMLEGRVNGDAPIRARLAAGKDSGGLSLHLTGDDAGSVLRSAGLIPFLKGGALDVRLVPRGAPGTYRGQMRIADIAIHGGPKAASFLSAISVVGALEQAAGKGITFDDVRAEFTLSPGQITLMASSATGPSIGMSLDGTVDLAKRTLNLQGVVSPIYFLNRIGSFMTRRGEGLFGLHYTVRGDMSAPRLAANPLSVLTPGFLREVFRGQNEQVGTQGAQGTATKGSNQ
ncbi:DUF3971 domain-containing protein [Rhodobacteraceae bacterium SC52]|nr:DUF3971 domain-containing protein [Rhodobacteraceae bacterium SC52]